MLCTKRNHHDRHRNSCCVTSWIFFYFWSPLSSFHCWVGGVEGYIKHNSDEYQRHLSRQKDMSVTKRGLMSVLLWFWKLMRKPTRLSRWFEQNYEVTKRNTKEYKCQLEVNCFLWVVLFAVGFGGGSCVICSTLLHCLPPTIPQAHTCNNVTDFTH